MINRLDRHTYQLRDARIHEQRNALLYTKTKVFPETPQQVEGRTRGEEMRRTISERSGFCVKISIEVKEMHHLGQYYKEKKYR